MRRPHRSPLRAGALATTLVLGALALACTPSGGDGGTAPDPPDQATTTVARTPAGGRLAFGLDAAPTGLNPAAALWSAADRQVALTMLETLTAHDDDGVAQPELAEEVTSDADATRWTVRLRPGLTLSDGRPVDAALVAEGLGVLRTSPALAAVLAPVADVAVTGDLDVVVTLSQPFPAFPHLLATQAGVVADPAWLRSAEAWHPVGTGAFVATDVAGSDRVVVRRNPSYWRRDEHGDPLPHLDEVELWAVPDSGARTAKLAAGHLDAIATTDPAEIARLRADADGGGEGEGGTVQLAMGPPGSGSEAVVHLRTLGPPFDDPTARAAVVLATDLTGLAATLRGEEPDLLDDDLVVAGRDSPAAVAPPATPAPALPGAPTSSGTTPTTSTTSTTVPPPAFDDEQATALASDLAATLGGPLTFELLVPTDGPSLRAAIALQAQWEEVGLVATIDLVRPEVWAARLAAGTYEAALGQRPAAPDAAADLGERTPSGGAIPLWLFHTPRAVAASADVGGLVEEGPEGEPAHLWPLWHAWLVG